MPASPIQNEVLSAAGYWGINKIYFTMFVYPRCCITFETEKEILDHLHLLMITLNYGMVAFFREKLFV